MIAFDANVLICLSKPDENPTLHERLTQLIEDLVKDKTVIGIPAPAWSEYLTGTDVATTGVIQSLKGKSSIRILPFDEIAAFELAILNRDAAGRGKKKGASKAPWQKVKFDRQILAICRTNRVESIVSSDFDLSNEGIRINVKVIDPLTIVLRAQQTRLPFDVHADESEPPPLADV